MRSNDLNPQPPGWLWQSVRWGFLMLSLSLAGLATAVALGVADPKPAGELKWEDRFDAPGRWVTFGEGVTIGRLAGPSGSGTGVPEINRNSGDPVPGLEIEVGRNEIAGAVIAAEAADYTFEAAGGQLAGEVGAAYGIVFGYQSAADYIGVLINGNGYVEVFSAGGRAWLPWQQWPNILLGYEANRLRVDVAAGQGLIRINDEVLITVPVGAGGVGVVARGAADGQRVRFGWAKLWSPEK